MFSRVIKNQLGTSLIEMTIAMVMFSFLVVVVAGTVSFGIASYAQGDIYNQLQNETSYVAGSMVSDIHRATQPETTNQYTDSHSTDWSGRTYLILDIPALDSSGNTLYQNESHLSVCTNEVIYYHGSNSVTIYRRTLKNSSGLASCNSSSANAAVTSCQSGCSATDQKLATRSTFYPYAADGVSAYTTSSRSLVILITSATFNGSGFYTPVFGRKFQINNKLNVALGSQGTVQ